jgi:16S rRNA G966 N2-methylase RsmD
VFFEADRSAAAILRRNITALKLEKRSRVVMEDLFLWAEKDPHPSPPPAYQGRGLGKANILFLDPPYRFLTERAADLRRLTEILAERHLAADAIVVFRHAIGDSLDLPALRRYDQRVYGSMAIDLLTCPSIPTSISPPPTQPG